MRRRDFLLASSAAALAPVLPAAGATATHDFKGRVLVLIELNGGNDGLNTVVPFADPLYASLRPRLALSRDDVLPLDQKLALNKVLEPLMPAWQAKDMAIALGVGYADPNRSHFRSIEVVETASDPEEVRTDGWIGGIFAEAKIKRDFATDGVVLGGPLGPLAGGDLKAIALEEPESFIRQAMNTPDAPARPANAALTHILGVRGEVRTAANDLGARLAAATNQTTEGWPQNRFARQLAVTARLIASGTPTAVYKIRHAGFDTHAGQLGTQRQLLTQFGEGLAKFRDAMIKAGAWDRVLVMTYAEFGRRVGENGSNGTDHGTAAPHFILGGRVKGGLYGEQPPLNDLDAGDLKFRLDFRRLYATASERWWGIARTPKTLLQAKPLEFLRA